jgi:hypothetical protein
MPFYALVCTCLLLSNAATRQQWVLKHMKRQSVQNVESEVLTTVDMEISVFLDITPCSYWKSTYVSEEHVTSIFRVT